MNNDIRNLTKWLNEDQEAPINRQALARVLAMAEQPAQQQEPVGRLESDPYEGHVFVPRIDGDWSMLGKNLYTSPQAQRTWVNATTWRGLTDEEIERCMKQAYATVQGRNLELAFAHAIEAKLREKNGIKGDA